MSYLSIGLPIRNEEEFLDKTLSLLLDQSFKDFEIIISDNVSEDKTSEIYQKFNDKRIKIYKQSTKLTSFENFNFTVQASKSKYFMWNSGHDFRSKNFLKEVINFLDKNNDYVGCCGDFKSNLDNKIDLFKYYSFDNLNINERLNFFKKIEYNYFVYSIFRTDKLKKTSLMTDVNGGDLNLIYELSFLGKLKRLKTNELTFMNIKENTIGNWNDYFKKHLLINNYKFWDIFKNRLRDFNKLLHKNDINFSERIKYQKFFILELIKSFFLIFFYESKSWLKKKILP